MAPFIPTNTTLLLLLVSVLPTSLSFTAIPRPYLSTANRMCIPATSKPKKSCLSAFDKKQQQQQQQHDDDIEKVDVVILGAGAAGLSAARTLIRDTTNKDLKCVVLEGRDRVGGRAFGTDMLGKRLDHGARWIHGASMANPIVQLVHEWGLQDQLVRNTPPPPSEDTIPDLVDVDSVSSPSSSSVPSEDFCHVDEETCDDIAEMDPDATLLRVLSSKTNNDKNPTTIQSKEPSLQAKQAAQEVMKEVLELFELASDDSDSDDDDEEEDFTLQEMLCQTYASNRKETASMEPDDIWHYMIRQNINVQTHVSTLSSLDDQNVFLEECFAWFCIEINQFFDNWEGAPIDRISARFGLENTILPGGNAWLENIGYSGLIEKAAQEILLESNNAHSSDSEETSLPPMIRLSHEVVSVITRPNGTTSTSDSQQPQVVVQCRVSNPDTGDFRIQEFHASACIVALPLGVLRAAISVDEQPPNAQQLEEESKREARIVANNKTTDGQLRFIPPLPSSLRRSINNLGIAVMDKVEMAFPYQWWPENIQRIALACSHLEQSPSYHPWTSFIVESVATSDGDKPNILVCYLHGDFAVETETKSDDQIRRECLKVLRHANLTADQVPDPVEFHVTRWLQDPYSRGCWTFLGKGSSPQDVRNFRENSDCHARGLFFAGEHTCSGSPEDEDDDDDDDEDYAPGIPGDDLGCLHGAWLSGELAAKAASEWLVAYQHNQVPVVDENEKPEDAIPTLLDVRFLEQEGQLGVA